MENVENHTLYRFKTTFGNIMGCEHPSNLHKIMMVDVWVPDNEKEVVEYIEKKTGLFVLKLIVH